MSDLLPPPALAQLLGSQIAAKLRRLRHRLFNRRRIVTTTLGFVLAAIWLGNAVVSITVREPYDADSFRSGVSLALLIYCLWHLVRVAWKRPDEAIEWTPAEQTYLLGGPFTRRQLLQYRWMVILTSTVLKAAIVSLFFLPDLPIWFFGCIGLLLGLTWIEFFRVLLETLVCGISTRAYSLFRGVVFAVVLMVAAYGFSRIGGFAEVTADESIKEWERAFASFHSAINELRASPLGLLLESPFRILAAVVTAGSFATKTWLSLVGGIGVVLGTAALAVRLDEYFLRRRIQLEQSGYHSVEPSAGPAANLAAVQVTLPVIPRCGGMWTLFWRQLLGARAHTGSLLASLIVPGILSCLWLTTNHTAVSSYLRVLASVVFYSFVLLPAAIKFDFRRDYDRLSLLKMLPLQPSFLVAGQLLTPVLITSMFQTAVLSLATIIRPVGPDLLWGALVMLIPLNLLFIGLDNLIFLLAPHRLNQEGFEVFLRTTLTFTGKAVLYGAMMVAVAAWAISSPRFALHWEIGRATMFFGGLSVIWSIAAAAVFSLVVRTFRRYDPSLDACG